MNRILQFAQKNPFGGQFIVAYFGVICYNVKC